MTLVLTRVSNSNCLQVTDRLVTTTAGLRFDAFANKNLLVLTRDATITIGYTGLAYIDKAPTDVFIAKVICQREFKRRFALETGNFLSAVHVPVYTILQRLAHALNEALPRHMPMSFELNLAGLQRTPSRIQGLFWQLYYSPTSGIQLGSFPIKRRPGKALFHVAPNSNLTPDQRNALWSRLQQTKTSDEGEAVMADVIRKVSTENRFVGPNCMSIFIGGREGRPVARTRFLPAEPHDQTIGVLNGFGGLCLESCCKPHGDQEQCG